MTNIENTTYVERLTEQINTYFRVVNDNPIVRLNEFKELANYAKLVNPVSILEVPAEGKMLERFYPSAIIQRADYVKINSSSHMGEVALTDWGLTNFNGSIFDAVLSLAPIHHANDKQKQEYVRGAAKVLKNNGVFAFGEVEEYSDLHKFLNEFVHLNSPSGHIGQYPNANFENIIIKEGFEEASSEVRACNWVFDSPESLHHYMTKLLALKPMSIKSLIDSVDSYLGITEESGKLQVNWSLRYYRGIKSNN